VDWLVGDGTDETNPGTYEEFIQSIDTVIMGYTTYHQIVTELSPDKWVYPGKRSYVITHKKLVSSDEIEFIDSDMEAFITNLKSEEGKDIWICGGASIINQLVALTVIV